METIKSLFILILILSTSLFICCKEDRETISLISQAESLLVSNPDSARVLLDSVFAPDNLGDKDFSYWCMLYSRTADTLYTNLPYIEQLIRAQSYFQSHGTLVEQVQIGLYLGRSYVEGKDYDLAMKTYLYLLDLALDIKSYNQAGYICSYMGDLLDFSSNYQEAIIKYQEAENYFQKAGNLKSAAFALRDLGRMYAVIDSSECALIYLQKANLIVTDLNDSIAMASINNGLGNTYDMLGNLELAESYLLHSIQLSSLDNAPNYVSLCAINLRRGNYEKAASIYIKQGYRH